MRDLLLFTVGGSRFAAPLGTVEEALDLHAEAVQGIPGENPALRGVFPLRGALVPLYDAHAVLGTPATTAATAMVVRPRGTGARVAIAVDDVEDVLDGVMEEEVRAPTGGADHDGVVRGVIHRGATITVLVDLYALVDACRATEGGDRG